MLLLARLILASLFADFILQSGSMARRKAESLGVIAAHSVIVVGVSVLASVDFLYGRTMVMLIALGVIHFLVDWGKVSIDRRVRGEYWPAVTFLLDQVLHLLVIIGLLSLFGFIEISRLVALAWDLTGQPIWTAIAAIYVAALFGGSVLVRIVVQSFEMKAAAKTGMARAGAYIGVLERLLLISLIAAGQFGAAGFVLAAKSVARYKQLDDQDFAEYFLIGTLTSIVIAMFAGLLVRSLLVRL